MIDWIKLVDIMRECAVWFGFIIAVTFVITIMASGRYYLTEKVKEPWAKEDKKRAKLEEKIRR